MCNSCFMHDLAKTLRKARVYINIYFLICHVIRFSTVRTYCINTTDKKLNIYDLQAQRFKAFYGDEAAVSL